MQADLHGGSKPARQLLTSDGIRLPRPLPTSQDERHAISKRLLRMKLNRASRAKVLRRGFVHGHILA